MDKKIQEIDTNNKINNKDEYINKLLDDNNSLFKQLHIVQAELEKYYFKSKCNSQTNNINNDLFMNFPQQAYEAIVENIKLNALVKQQQIILNTERQNSLTSILGKILINGVSSVKEFILLPNKLYKTWKSLSQTIPPKSLGGKQFKYVIEAFTLGGDAAVEKLLNSVFISSIMRANAYTELARHLQSSDIQKASYYAKTAWETDPQPYRLKWLIFRMHEAGDTINADAIIDILPQDISMSDSEKRHIQRIHNESKDIRVKQAKNIIESLRRNNEYTYLCRKETWL